MLNYLLAALSILSSSLLTAEEGGHFRVLDVLNQRREGFLGIMTKAELPILARHLEKSAKFIEKSMLSLNHSPQRGLGNIISALRVNNIAEWSLQKRLGELFVKEFDDLTKDEVFEIVNGLIYLFNHYGRAREQFWFHLDEFVQDSSRPESNYLQFNARAFEPPKPPQLDQGVLRGATVVQETTYKMWYYFGLTNLAEALINSPLSPNHMHIILRMLRFYETTDDLDTKMLIFTTMTSLREEFIKHGSDFSSPHFADIFNADLFALHFAVQESLCRRPQHITTNN